VASFYEFFMQTTNFGEAKPPREVGAVAAILADQSQNMLTRRTRLEAPYPEV
jgi:hypothetical protein